MTLSQYILLHPRRNPDPPILPRDQHPCLPGLPRHRSRSVFADHTEVIGSEVTIDDNGGCAGVTGDSGTVDRPVDQVGARFDFIPGILRRSPSDTDFLKNPIKGEIGNHGILRRRSGSKPDVVEVDRASTGVTGVDTEGGDISDKDSGEIDLISVELAIGVDVFRVDCESADGREATAFIGPENLDWLGIGLA